MEGDGEIVPLLAVRASLSQHLLLMEIIDLCRHLLQEINLIRNKCDAFFHLKTLLLCHAYSYRIAKNFRGIQCLQIYVCNLYH